MAIEVRELVIRAIVSTQGQKQSGEKGGTAQPKNGEAGEYLEQLMEVMKDKDER